MHEATPSVIDLKSFSADQIEEIFGLAKHLKESPQKFPTSANFSNRARTLALMFFEPSTRTRFSFETAAHRAGFSPLVFESSSGTSLDKGETIEDTILNIAALEPSLIVIRCGDKVNLPQLIKKISMPVINAGWGMKGHPTQALLDIFTLKQRWQTLRGKKLVIVGDARHSRVAASHKELASLCGIELAFCGPQELLPEGTEHKTFTKLSEALTWTDAVMALRMQFERHSAALSLSKQDYRAQFGLTLASIKDLRSSSFILHPGPINHGHEIDSEVLDDPRCLELEQVTAGTFVREALLRWLDLGGKS